MTAKERLRNLVEDLSEEEAETALVIVERRRSDPMLQALAQAPADDEPSSPQEDRSAREAGCLRARRACFLPRRAQARSRHRLSERWSYAVTSSARRDLRRLDPPVRRRIVEGLDRFVADPYGGDIRKLNPLEWRLRIGDWRVRFAFDDERRLIVVLRVLPRGRAYRD